jgi:subtilase family serine protease
MSALGCTQANIDAVDADFVKLAARGISTIFASGDSGSGYQHVYSSCTDVESDTAFEGTIIAQAQVASNYQCCDEADLQNAAGWSGHMANDAFNCTLLKTVTSKKAQAGYSSGRIHPKPVKLYPSWPASSPWVTAVGATRFVGQKAGNEEMASDQFGSGGGFSARFGQSPDAKWQSDDVANYLKVVPKGAPFPPSGSFPPQGRATPDVSALGEGYQVFQSGAVLSVGGTSASAPAFAGIVSLLNEQRLNKGGKPLGFLNPFLYQNADAFTDVTKGNNAIGRQTGPIPYGFNCTKGWDPATGIGTPKFDKLLQAVLN